MDFFTCSLEKLEFVQLVMGMNSKKYDEYTFTSKLKVCAIWIFVSLAKAREKRVTMVGQNLDISSDISCSSL